MQLVMPEHVREIIRTLEKAGYEAYAVGGCVRDSLLGKKPKDWDITTSASPKQVKELFSRTIDTGIQHGTVTVMMEKEGYEVTTYRIDGKYEDGRHPSEVIYTRSLEEDLKRRDFTINAMAYNESRGIVDLFDGQRDLKQRVIRCVGDARKRFSEDALRMMRAARFAAQLGFEIEEETLQAMKELAENMKLISAERIQSELVKLLISAHPKKFLVLYKTGITAVVLPEFDVMMETPQNHPYHKYNVGMHTMEAVNAIRADKVLRLSMFFHDIGKPKCRFTDEKGIDHFYYHPVESEQITKGILKRLKFDNDTISKVCRLVRYHDVRPTLREKNLRRVISKVSAEMYPYLLEVQVADAMGQSDYRKDEKLAYLQSCGEMYREILQKNQCLKIADLAVNGKDLIEAGVPQGKMIGENLSMMLEKVLDDPRMNTKENLLSMIVKG
ncbi:CCA tRNA nucleotidyltransferase [Eubacterium oxidoreducens]|uniref:tRNA nucleotidyltransferase (CCA-adding enzyme) n=1 Tax=Eubacterium oxidoreducens TaxID=1732 RepID=A0A1G6BWR4_EUBOX|nr:CCA tRNA nucleotidyltransferase [Eubacterium oxidoreducens]SDB24967.1 tRNA nucleotidyltransferase (CCA-adding enzyme) [Eubacterium oxidoreducens]